MTAAVRWLGAFRPPPATFLECARAEIAGLGRQVSTEPLWRGRSLMCGAPATFIGVGLVLDPALSRFVRGWAQDAHTVLLPDGTLRPTKDRAVLGPEFSSWKALIEHLDAQDEPFYFGEAVFECPHYWAVAWRADMAAMFRDVASEIAAAVGLPAVSVEPQYCE